MVAPQIPRSVFPGTMLKISTTIYNAYLHIYILNVTIVLCGGEQSPHLKHDFTRITRTPLQELPIETDLVPFCSNAN